MDAKLINNEEEWSKWLLFHIHLGVLWCEDRPTSYPCIVVYRTQDINCSMTYSEELLMHFVYPADFNETL